MVIAHPNLTKNQDALASACAVLGSTLATLGQHRGAQEAYRSATIIRSSFNPIRKSRYKESLLEVETKLAESEKASKPQSVESLRPSK